MNLDARKLRDEVFECEHCAGLNTFTRSPNNSRFYKFPPIIGSSGEADILFIGINPRRSKSNFNLHDWLMASPEAFAKLSANQAKDGNPYIALDGREEHYHCHMIVIKGVFGQGTKFEAKAAVTELMLCASTNEPAVLSQMKSPCAALYLNRVIRTVNPQVVIAVGSGVLRHLQTHFHDAIHVPIVKMEHPRQLNGMDYFRKVEKLEPTIASVRQILLKNVA